MVLGVGTILAKRDGDGALDLEGEEQRVLTLLSVAYGRPIDASILGAIRRASKHVRAGNLPMAALHIALAGLPKLSDPSDAARRIFIADGLLAKGIRPRDIFSALEFDPAPLDQLEKYNPAEPRVPKGSGRPSGQWTHENDSVAANVAAAVVAVAEGLPEIEAAAGAAPVIAAAASDAAAAVVAPAVVAAALLIPTPEKSSNTEGPVEGHPNLRYAWNSDDTGLRIYRTSDGRTVLRATLINGKVRVGPKIVGRKKGDKVEINSFALPPDWPWPNDGDDERRLCPKESPDRVGRPEEKGGDKDRDFEDQMKRWVNPDNPTPRGMGYAFPNPSTGNTTIIFDDCQRRTGYLFDAKGTGYLALLTNKSDWVKDGVIAKLITQAKSQIAASQGREIYWCFAEARAAKMVENFSTKMRIKN